MRTPLTYGASFGLRRDAMLRSRLGDLGDDPSRQTIAKPRRSAVISVATLFGRPLHRVLQENLPQGDNLTNMLASEAICPAPSKGQPTVSVAAQ